MNDNIKESFAKLRAPFSDLGAFSVDKSRGVALIGVRGAYIIERLNEVFGLEGYGWRWWPATYSRNNNEVSATIVLQYRVSDGGPAYGYNESSGRFEPYDSPPVWSEPIFAVGGNNVKGGSTPLTDAIKGAWTDAISKAASTLGVASDAYKGKYTVGATGEIVMKDSDVSLSYEVQEAMMVALAGSAPDLLQEIVDGDESSYELYKSVVLKPIAEFVGKNGMVEVAKEFLGVIGQDHLSDCSVSEAMRLYEALVALVGGVPKSEAIAVLSDDAGSK